MSGAAARRVARWFGLACGDTGRARGMASLGRAAVAAALLAASGACAGGEEVGGEADTAPARGAAGGAPDTVRIAQPGLHPEGVEWDDSRGRFLIGSVTAGTVTAVADDGTLDEFVPAVEGVGSIGLHIDREADRLWVAYADVSAFGNPERQGAARIGIYDLSTGEGRVVDLGALRSDARHFANDVTVGPEGTAYVTDSFHPILYAVTPEGEASVFLEDDRLAAEPAGLNGIDLHPDGYLLAAIMGRNALVKIPLDDPEGLTEVELPEPISGDGLVLAPDGTLVVVGTTFTGDDNPRSEVLWLASTDAWATARITARAPAGGATTGTLRAGEVYVVNPHFEALGGADPHPSFEIYRVEPGSGTGSE